jgi:hypothetical protein
MFYRTRPRSIRIISKSFLFALFVLAGHCAICTSVLKAQAPNINGVSLLDSSVNPKATYLITTNKGRKYAGRIEIKVPEFLVMTRRNGRIVRLTPDEIRTIKKVADNFTSKTFLQIREKLEKEFGSKYQVSQTRHFLVVHPPGKYETWALPFEQLFERFKAYFKTRGMTISEPEFPMVAVVLRSHKEFRSMADRKSLSQGVIGYYSLDSNRLISYRHNSSWQDDKSNWADTMDTIIHEATHQTACNTGVHSRIAINPRWVTEGLATMFEAKGVNNYFKYPDPVSRINWGRLESLRQFYDEKAVAGNLENLVSTDQLFRTQPEKAYALSWGLTSYLAERNPHRYVQYIELLQKKEFSSSLTPAIRLKCFVQSFGSPESVEAGLRQYIDRLPNRKKSVAKR